MLKRFVKVQAVAYLQLELEKYERMKRKIETRADIEFLVDTFYKQMLQNEKIGHFFTEVIQLSWEKHMPVMYSFWETVLLGEMSYKGNPMLKHIDLDRKASLDKAHFEEWVRLWKATVEAHFEGEKAEEAILRAETMKQLMWYKVRQSRDSNFIQ